MGCAFWTCCDYKDCYPDKTPKTMKHFDECNSRLVDHCGDAKSTDEFEACVHKLAESDDERCSFGKTVPDFPVPMWYEPEWKGNHLSDSEVTLNGKGTITWGKEHGADHVLSLAARRAGGTLVKSKRFQVYRK